MLACEVESLRRASVGDREKRSVERGCIGKIPINLRMECLGKTMELSGRALTEEYIQKLERRSKPN